jgi:Uncharacterised protein family (UPF0236)
VRDSSGLHTTISLSPVNCRDRALGLTLDLQATVPLPDQDEHLPERIEAHVHRIGIEVQRRLFKAFIEKADRELVLLGRDGKGGQGIQRRGSRPFTFKTLFGEVTVERSRIRHNQDGSWEVPAARAWGTPRQLAITAGLRDAACDQMGQRSAGRSRAELCRDADEEDLLGRSTVIDIVHREGAALAAAQARRADAALACASEAQLALLGVPAADIVCQEHDDDPTPEEADEDAQAQWVQAPPEAPKATGFPGGAQACAVPRDEPRAVDPGFVIVQPDEVKAKAQAGAVGKEVWLYTAVVLVAGLRTVLVAATVEGLWAPLGAALLGLGVLDGGRSLLVLADGASWIRAWFEGLGAALPKAMIVCWWHLRRKCYERLSAAGGPKQRRRGLEREVLDLLWEGQVDAAIAALRSARDWVRAPKALGELIAYLERRRAYLPNYRQRQEAGLWIASTRVEKWNDWAVSARCKHRGMSWSEQGVLALAALEAARRNGELDAWRRQRELPESPWPEAVWVAA